MPSRDSNSFPNELCEEKSLYSSQHVHMVHESDFLDSDALDQSQDNDEPLREKRHQLIFRKLYAILSLMTLVLLIINVLQVCLLTSTTNWFWLTLFPGVVFFAFVGWAVALVCSNRSEFFPENVAKTINTWEGLSKLGRIFQLKEEDKVLRPEVKRHWPRGLSRAGVLLTIILNVIMVEFIYFPIFAVPAFKEITWKVTLNTNTVLPTPAVILQAVNSSKTALGEYVHLSPDPQQWEYHCRELERPLFKQWCFTEYVQPGFRYAIFDPNNNGVPNLAPQEVIGLYYEFLYNGTYEDSLASIGFFDPKFIPHLYEMLDCGRDVVSWVSVAAGKWNVAALQASHVHDELNAIGRAAPCLGPVFEDYESYLTSTTDIGSNSKLPFDDYIDCDLDSPGQNGTCQGYLTMNFASGIQSVYSSAHAKNWITILTEEGGVVGAVTFLTWFFSIF